MGSLYLTKLADWLRLAGIPVVEYQGWQTRARSSGGFDSGRPVCVMWHHDASSPGTNPENTAYYSCFSADAKPICNLQIDRTGTAWILAAGATNTNGSGGPIKLPSGKTVPQDSMNTHAVGMEICNNGLGEPYPIVQIDNCFKASIAISKGLGLPVDDVCTHQFYAPTRKIDPATAAASPWPVHAVTSSGSWSLADLQAELRRRDFNPPLPEDDDFVSRAFVRNGNEPNNANDTLWNAFVVFSGGKFWVPTNEALGRVQQDFGYAPIDVDDVYMQSTGPVVGPCPETADAWGCWKR